MSESTPPTERATPIVEAIGVSKRFGSTEALRGVDAALQAGRCLGLVGRNGAGKSTLVSILSGLQAPDIGVIRFAGELAPPIGDVRAWRGRISTVFQHSMVVPQLTVAENIFLGDLPGERGLVNWRATRARARSLLREWDFDVDPAVECGTLTVEQRQIVEIAGALARGTRVLLLDEPTAALERDAVRRLFERVRTLVASGVAVLYISHHLEEVFEICHEVVVLRDGEAVMNAPTVKLTEDELVGAMVGDIDTPSSPARTTVRRRMLDASEARLVVTDVVAASPRGSLLGASLTVEAGERVGVTGLLGAGVATLGRVIAGAHGYESGAVRFEGKPLPPGRPDAALAAGIGYVPEDRWLEGFVGELGCAENMTMSIAGRLAGPLGLLKPSARARAAQPLADRLSLVSRGLNQRVVELSGGNQQKVTVARAVASKPKLIVAITPTRGVDVASKELLLSALADLSADNDASLLLASDEFDDLQICDRVVILVRGQVFAEFTEPPFDDEELIAATEGLATAGRH
ncbi:MAG: sugar ABC transporter ATP-binding protein [Actinobacteria bacterium]|nr:sugar ABC transporter ATP-binding protein [Actinomycetota bacterium]MBV8480423.1 sugar ABC transporter ATP-binding protein [Actinomycetota bacterium]